MQKLDTLHQLPNPFMFVPHMVQQINYYGNFHWTSDFFLYVICASVMEKTWVDDISQFSANNQLYRKKSTIQSTGWIWYSSPRATTWTSFTHFFFIIQELDDTLLMAVLSYLMTSYSETIATTIYISTTNILIIILIIRWCNNGFQISPPLCKTHSMQHMFYPSFR